MTLTFAGELDRNDVIHAVDQLADLVGRPEVAEAWTQESSCSGMSVGGLTRHLGDQAVNIVKLLRPDNQAPPDVETIAVLEHYARAVWLREDLEGDANRSIRESADRQASTGHEVAVTTLAAARGDLEAVLADAPPTTYIPWQGWALATDDFLVTRLMEMVVHADDLAVSVDVDPPRFEESVLDPVLRLLTGIAVRRHGQDALVRTLSRPDRAPQEVSAF
ncbi:MAG: maleylpyruvate isomerase N-terminal domain-containing protein [Nocardioidaceae bacterium]